MENIVNQSIVVNEDERQVLEQAVKILQNVNKELDATSTAMLDEQTLDDAIEAVINIALKIELKKVYSVFNALSSELRSRISREVYLAYTK